MTALVMDMRELNIDEIENVSGGILPLIALGVSGAALFMAAKSYMLNKGAADHDANCKEH